MSGMSQASGSILAVCTGNICRSPAVEVLLRAAAGDAFRIASAGTRAVVGAGISPPMAALLADGGFSPLFFSARQLFPEHVRAADLVLTATAAHRAAVVQVAPAAVRRTFTVLEFARIVELLGVRLGEEPLADLVPRVAAARFAVAPGQDDLRDPYGQSDAVYLQSYEHIRAAVGTMTGRPVPVH